MKDEMDERKKSENWWKKKWNKKPTEKQRKMFFWVLNFLWEKSEGRKDQQGISRRVSK